MIGARPAPEDRMADSAPASSRSTAGGPRGVLEASAAAQRDGDAATLAVVLETEGSTYVRPGALALFGARHGQVGWLSGGCIEPDIERLAQRAAQAGRIEWMDIDTRHDEDLLSGSALGCRGRLRLALLPLAGLDGWPALVQAWMQGEGTLQMRLQATGTLALSAGEQQRAWTLPAAPVTWAEPAHAWQFAIARAPSILVFGAGPETPALLPMLRMLGCITMLVEHRPRWSALARLADHALDLPPSRALDTTVREWDAALVMHHNFELDREALLALADSPIGFIGLLGPVRRREDLFRVLPAATRDALTPRLHSPIGLALGGEGPEAIALSIAAQLQRYLHDGQHPA
jgi:xanthine dehydrogenase accessory factor